MVDRGTAGHEVRHAQDGDLLEPGCVYVCPPGMHMTAEHCVRLVAGPRLNFVRPSVDLMFRSAAHAYGDRAIGVVLSGSGSDGAIGCTAIIEAGGTVIAQDPACSEYPGMPEAAVGRGQADLIVPIEHIGDTLRCLVDPARSGAEGARLDCGARAIKVLLADDHRILLDGLRTLLSSESDMQVVAEAADGRAAVRLAGELSPDVVVMDIAMPQLNGVDATRRIKQGNPLTGVVALSARTDAQAAARIVEAGATGYLCKNAAFSELPLRAARRDFSGEGGGDCACPARAGSCSLGLMRLPSPLLPLLFSFASLSLVACGDDDDPGGQPAGSGGAGAAGGAGGEGGQGGAVPGDILDQLQAIEGVEVVEEVSEIDGYRFFLLEIDQPADHNDPDGVRFRQRIALHHRDASAPLVLASTGYYLWLPYQYLEEPAQLLGANQLIVEHRFFYTSRPDPADWALLNIWQAATDHHRVVEAFRPLYPASWISTGASKGGMTSVYHRRFYPDDVDGTVPYVAPHSAGLDDARYIDFLDQVGNDVCRQRLKDFGREVLLRRDAMLTRMADQAAMAGVTYDLLGIGPVLEGNAAGFAFGFWQYHGAYLCDDIPTAAASDDQVWGFLDAVGSPISSSDPYLLAFEPYYWQAYTQLGAPGIDESHVADLLLYDWDTIDDLPSVDEDPVFDPQAMQDVSSWLTTQGERLLFIYGEDDPWTAAAFDFGGAQDTYRFIEPGGNHGASIGGLVEADQAVALAALEDWTGVTPISPMGLLPPAAPQPPQPPPLRLLRQLRQLRAR